jgi:hypothetical protein
MRTAIALFVFALLPLGAQEIQFPGSFEKLAAKAKETVNVSLDSAMLQLAGNFLSSNRSNEAKAKEITKGLKGLYVRSFEFEREDQYSDADLAPIRAQLTSARGWSKIVDVNDKSDRAEVYAKKDGERLVGLTVIAAEKRELTVVYVDGPIDLAQLSGMMNLNLPSSPSSAGKK